VAGKIVLIDRGFVEFDVQATNATAAGAVGIIVVNNIGDPAVPSMQQTTKGTGVPDVMISQNDGDTIKAAASFGADGTAANQTQLGIGPDVQADRISKLDASNGNLKWYVLLGNDGALAVDPGDLSIYTARGGHNFGNDGFTYKLDVDGNFDWAGSVTLNSYCDFFYVTNVAVDAFSSNPGVVWSENGCFGALAKTDRATGAQQWSLLTYDIDRPSIDPTNGQIYAISDAGSSYVAETIYSVTADGSLSYTSSCEGFSDLNPADSHLYRGGGNPGCGLTLSQMNTSSLGSTNWDIDLSPYIGSFDSLAVQPWAGGYIYVASVASSKIVVVDPITQTVVTTFNTAYPPKHIAVNPDGGNVYVADDTHPTVITYGPNGALIWINPNVGGTVTNLATARGIVGQSSVPVSTVATGAASNVTDTTATLNGTVNPNGSSTTVYFQYGTTTSYGSQTASQVFTGSSVQNVTANLTGLTSNTTYHYRVIAINAGGTIAGNDVTFTTASPTPTPTPTPCPVPTIRISTSRSQLPKGQEATITISGKNICNDVTVYYTVKTRAQNGVDYTLTDQFGQDATGGQSSGPLTLRCLYTARKKMLPVHIQLQHNRAYYLGNKSVTVNLLP
jgi:hypothetical protein